MQNIVCDAHTSIDSISSTGRIDFINSIESEQTLIDSIDFKAFTNSIDAILVPRNKSPTFKTHTKGGARFAHANNNSTNEARASRAPRR